MKTEKITRQYNFNIRAEQDEKHGSMITGTPIVFEQESDVGGFLEIIDRGALDKCDLHDVRFLVNHNTDMIPLARSRNNNENSTMQMTVGDAGLDIRVDLDTENNTDARNLYSSLKRGDITGMSFMFTIPEGGDEWKDLRSECPRHIIHQIDRVYEVSAVTFPAYEQTNIEARSQLALDSAKQTLESAIKRSEEMEAAKKAEEEKIKAEAEARAKAEAEEKAKKERERMALELSFTL